MKTDFIKLVFTTISTTCIYLLGRLGRSFTVFANCNNSGLYNWNCKKL